MKLHRECLTRCAVICRVVGAHPKFVVGGGSLPNVVVHVVVCMWGWSRGRESSFEVVVEVIVPSVHLSSLSVLPVVSDAEVGASQ